MHEYGHNANCCKDLPGKHRYDDDRESAHVNIMNSMIHVQDNTVKNKELNKSEGTCFMEEEND